MVIFAPAGAPPAASMPNATPRPMLTPLHALVVVAVARYLERARQQEVRSGISELEIQKLVYFLKVLGGAFPLGFARGRYGPYAERLPQVLDLLEGRYLSGFGDHSARVEELAPIVPLDTGLAEAEAVVGALAEDVERLERLLRLASLWSTPFLEPVRPVCASCGSPARAGVIDAVGGR